MKKNEMTIQIEVADLAQAYADELSRVKHDNIMLTLENRKLREMLEAATEKTIKKDENK